jgi:PPIC-type PPIASE domain
LRALLREPLLHFLLLGALLFALDAWLRPGAAVSDGSSEIVVSEARVRNLAQTFARTWQRPPTRQELDGLVENFVREEVMVREALALGLDRDDAIIRRRLQQKVEFIADDGAQLAAPADAELDDYLKLHAGVFRTEPRISFAQVYLDPQRRGAALQADAAKLRAALDRGREPTDPERAGDRLSLLEPRYDALPQSEVARLFGAAFADALVQQPVGRWSGPIVSGYGAHLVRVDAQVAGGLPSLEAVRPLVEREWANARRQQLSQAQYGKLRAKYTVKVASSQATQP